MKTPLRLALAAAAILAVLAAVAYFVLTRFNPFDRRGGNVIAFIRDPQAHSDWLIQANTRCGDAPFQFPTSGFAGYLWDDSFRIGHRHQGVDIFGGAQPGQTPIYAAYPGYLTREAD
jgi:murein DD-endopeptidase MepM/ murein hydrolase activator NlpD